MRTILLSLFFIWMSSEATAGLRVGNGGGVWVCHEKGGFDVRWIWLTDLFEAEQEFGLEIQRNNEGEAFELAASMQAYIRSSIPMLKLLMEQHPVDLDKSIHFLPGGAVLTYIPDGLHRVMPAPESCSEGYLYYGQIANFTNEGKLLISKALWESPAITVTDRAALLIHEVVYKILREAYGDENSVRAREIVGLLFSDLPDEKKNKEIERVLRTPAPAGDGKTPPQLIPKVLVCTGSVESQGKIEELPLVRRERALGMTVGDYRFFVLTVPGVLTPAYLSIEDEVRGLGSSLDSSTLELIFQTNKAANLILENKASGEKATLSCWIERSPVNRP